MALELAVADGRDRIVRRDTRGVGRQITQTPVSGIGEARHALTL